MTFLATFVPPPEPLPPTGRCLVAFECDHPFEARCNSRVCGEGRPVLRRVWTDDYRPAMWRASDTVEGDVADPVEDDAPVAHPEPEVRSRPATPEETPSGAKGLIGLAERAGWTAHARYARGTSTDARGRPTRVVESVLVWLEHPDGHRACAEWVDGKAVKGRAGTWLALAGLWRETLGVTELRAAVRAVGGVR